MIHDAQSNGGVSLEILTTHPSEALQNSTDNIEASQCHLGGSEREGNAEETHMSPDVQVDGVVFPEKYQKLAPVEINRRQPVSPRWL